MVDTISNKCKKCKNCKNCKWLKIGRHNADFSRGEGICTHPYRNNVDNVTGRVFSSIACRFFEEREDNMDIEKTIKDCESKLDNLAWTIDQLEEQLVEEPSIPEEANIPINRYGIGETLYLPVKITGVEELVSVNGSTTVVYDVRAVEGRYITTIPESILVENFKEG